MNIRVVNMKREKAAIKIDRSSRYGNPFRIGPDGDRDRVIHLYRIYLAKRIIWNDWGEYTFRTLAAKPTWGCWCVPEPCHGHVLKSAVTMFMLEGMDALKRRCKSIIRNAPVGDVNLVIERARSMPQRPPGEQPAPERKAKPPAKKPTNKGNSEPKMREPRPKRYAELVLEGYLNR